MMQPDEIIVDSFAGGGGASQGILWALGRSPDIAINHDKEAIALHAANHPDSLHLAEDVWHVDPVEACAGRPVGLMWLSPDCKHFSKAKGGKPVSKKIRGLAWVACRWAKAVRPRVIVLENVEEFQTWGPVDRVTQRPDAARKGLTFKRFIGRLGSLGYEVEFRELRACDYGAPTIRKRLFLIARCDGVAITWPAPTHGKNRAHPWRTAAECIQWEIPCPSIFERKKPLADNTLKRIARGLKRFVIESPNPFIVNLTHHGSDRVEYLDEPMRTITGAKRGEKALVVPSLIQTGYGERTGQAPRSLDLHQPLGTLVSTQKHALVAAFMAKHYGGNESPGSQLTMPLGTVTTQDHNHLVAAHITKFHGDSAGAGIDQPMPTVTANSFIKRPGGAAPIGVVASTLVNMRGTEDRHLVGQSITEPLPTISGGGIHAAEVRAFMVAYYGNEKDGGSLHDPMRTVTSKDRLGLVTVEGVDYAIADIGMRMLAPRELYRAQGFPDSYKIEIEYRGKPLTKTAQVRMVGNSVCPPLAAAIVASNVGAPAVEVAA